MAVLVLDLNSRALMPCTEKRAKLLLARDRARVHRILPFAIRIIDRHAASCEFQALRIKLDSGSKVTGMALVREVEVGGKTKYNRSRLNIPKMHSLDAVCVGTVDFIQDWNKPTLNIKSMGRGCYQRTHLTAFGFPRGYQTRIKNIQGFQTGDMVKTTVTKGKRIGAYSDRGVIRATGNFNIQTAKEVIQGISHRYCQIVQRGDGYGYSQTGAINGNRRGQVGSKARTASQSALTFAQSKGLQLLYSVSKTLEVSPALSPVFHAQI